MQELHVVLVAADGPPGSAARVFGRTTDPVIVTAVRWALAVEHRRNVVAHYRKLRAKRELTAAERDEYERELGYSTRAVMDPPMPLLVVPDPPEAGGKVAS